VSIDISLERNEYTVGETAKGTLTISEDKDFKVEGLELSVSGEERIIEISEGQSFENRRITAQESNVFFSKDLSHFLSSIGTEIEDDGDKNDNILKVAGGITKVPFEFSIPDDALESYEDKYARTLYKIEAAVNMPRRLDIDRSLFFTVFNQKRKHMKFDSAITEEIKEKTNSGIRLELEGDKNTFSPGEIIRGKITIEDSKLSPKIRKVDLILGAVEFVQAQGKKKRTEIFPNYKERIEWNKASDSSSSAVVPFKMHIPKDIKRSYLGKYSEYYWLIEAKVDIPWSDDLYGRTIIQIV
jgi:Arrestin (or S-antigen), N-terminal domain